MPNYRGEIPITDVRYDHGEGWRFVSDGLSPLWLSAAHDTPKAALQAAISAHYGDGYAHKLRVPYRSKAFETALQMGWHTLTVNADDIATMVPSTMMYGNPPCRLKDTLADITRHQRDFK